MFIYQTSAVDGAAPGGREVRAGRTLLPAAGDGQDGRIDRDGPDPRLAPLRASLAARLGPVCRDWDPAAFRTLVERIAHTQLRWAEQDRLD